MKSLGFPQLLPLVTDEQIPGLLTCHHTVGGLLVAVVTGGDWVMKAGGAVPQSVAEGGRGQMHVGAFGRLT